MDVILFPFSNDSLFMGVPFYAKIFYHGVFLECSASQWGACIFLVVVSMMLL